MRYFYRIEFDCLTYRDGRRYAGLKCATCFPAYFPEGISFEDFERDLLVKAMIKANGVLGRGACLLGMSYRTLQYRLNKFGIEKEANSAPKGLSPKPKGASQEGR